MSKRRHSLYVAKDFPNFQSRKEESLLKGRPEEESYKVRMAMLRMNCIAEEEEQQRQQDHISKDFT